MELGYLEFIKQLINAHEGDSKVLEFFAESKPELKPAIDELLEVINNNKDLLSEAFFYKELFEKSGDALSVIKNGRFIDTNTAAMNCFKFPNKASIVNMHPSELSPEFQPDGEHSYKKAEEIMRVALEKGSNRFEWLHELADGEQFMAEIVLTTLVNEPDRQIFHSSMRNISDQKLKETQLENAYRTISEIQEESDLILQSAGEGIYGLDLNGNTTFANQAAQDIMGYTQEEMIGINQHQLIHHSRADGSAYDVNSCSIYSALKDGKVHKIDNEVFWHKNGKPVPVQYTSTPIIDKSGKIKGAVVCFQDISDRVRAQKELVAALDELSDLKNQLEVENAYLQEEIKLNHNFEEIISKSKAFKKVLKDIQQVSQTNATVLIHGESGTGKELLARAVHNLSDRKDKALVKVNCAALPANLIESELFGHKKGAFTGAVMDKPGRFQLADKGSIFLDEIGELPLELQAKLLRVLQEGEFEVLGDTKTQKVDVRVIAATNVDLLKASRSGEFREDLYYRLNVFPITVPPLRDRKEDISLLAQHFILKHSTRLGRETQSLTKAGLAKLLKYDWPGNVRELENIIERSIITSSGSRLNIDQFFVTQNAEATVEPITLEEVEREHILKILNQCKWKVSGPGGAAELLGLKRTTLEARMAKLGIKR